jgi:uncharacterized protein (TIGR02271 family)
MRLEERYADYKVYERGGEKIGKVDELFVDENDQPEYISVNIGFLGTKSTLIPMDIVREDEELRVFEVSQPKSKIKEGPTFDDDEEITPEYEERIRSYYGLESFKGSAKQGAYGTYYREDSEGGVYSRALREDYLGEKREDRKRSEEIGHSVSREDAETIKFDVHASEQEGLRRTSTDLGEGENELRVQRAEEELVSGTREREIGGVHLRKRVRTDRERVKVPKRREEVHVERVPVDREASEAEIGEEEFFMPVIEEEVVVEKRPVAKEEIRLRKEVIEEEEVVERDVRKEEVDIDDEAERQVVLEHDLDTDNERRHRSA